MNEFQNNIFFARRIRSFLWRIQSPIHRDLVWLIGSHSLFQNSTLVPCVSSQMFQNFFLEAENWFLEEDKNPERLLAFVDTPRKYKLGLYAEDLFLYFLRYGSFYEVLAHDLQIFCGTSCIGAMDFIVQSKEGGVEHWEMAMKYFVQHHPSSDWKDFIGPTGKDNLERKLQKMLQRQLLLSQQNTAIDYLETLGIPKPTTHKIISLGLFFHHVDHVFIPPISGELNQPTGFWCQKSVFLERKNNSASLWFVMRHPKWLAPILTKQKHDLLSIEQLMEVFVSMEDFVMVAEMQCCEQGWEEIQRWIVVVDHWKRIPDPIDTTLLQYP